MRRGITSAGPELVRSAQLLDDPWNTVSMGISRLTVAASSVASATVATVKPGLQARVCLVLRLSMR